MPKKFGIKKRIFCILVEIVNKKDVFKILLSIHKGRVLYEKVGMYGLRLHT